MSSILGQERHGLQDCVNDDREQGPDQLVLLATWLNSVSWAESTRQARPPVACVRVAMNAL